jgi:hypothetical protein
MISTFIQINKHGNITQFFKLVTTCPALQMFRLQNFTLKEHITMTKIFIIESKTSPLWKFETNIQNLLIQIAKQEQISMELFFKNLSVKIFRSHMHMHW